MEPGVQGYDTSTSKFRAIRSQCKLCVVLTDPTSTWKVRRGGFHARFPTHMTRSRQRVVVEGISCANMDWSMDHLATKFW
jgi:hypothetical protein